MVPISMAFLFLGPNRLASPRVNGYLVKASSNLFTFYDSPLPGVNTPWDVMRIVNHFAAAVFVAVSILKVFKTEDLSRKLEVNYVKFQFRGGLLVPTGRNIVPAGYIVPTGMDKAKITRKPSKTGKHGHGKRKSTKEAGKSSQSQKVKALSQLWVQKSNSRVQEQDGRVNSYSEVLIGGNPQGECHVNMKKAQGMGIFTLESLSEKAQGVTITDCHAGNPCVHICDPTSQSKYPMIGMNKGWRLKGACKSAQTLEEHPSDTYVLTMKMEILLEPASNKLLVGDSLNLPDHRIHKDGDGDASFQLESDSLPHAHAQTTKTYYKHQDSRIMKAQELKTKTSAQTLIYKIFLQRYQVYQGRLLASFQDDAKYEHVGQDTRSQGGKDDQDGRIKI
ncbi:hypothetical protein Tco_1104016 [Tanacetum coccineum]